MRTQQMTGHEVQVEGLEEALANPFELMTAGEVATWLRVTKAWVYTQTRANRIPYVPLGRYVRYRRSAVAEWLAEMEHEPVASQFRRA